MDTKYNTERIQRDLNKIRTDFSLDSFLFTDPEQRTISQKLDDFEKFVLEMYHSRN